jgi:hypothetical protein
MAVVDGGNGESISSQDELSVKVKPEDVLKRLSWRVKRSVSFLTVYVIVILANLFVLIWEITGSAIYSVSIAMEALINIVFAIEVTVEIITQEKYFSSWWNRIDFAICMLCIISFIAFCIYYSVSDDSSSVYSTTSFDILDDADDDDSNQDDGGTFPLDINDVDMGLLLVRYIFQSIKLCRFMVTAAKRKKTQRLEQDIEFPDTQAEDYLITKGSNEYVSPEKMNYETIIT